MEHHRVKAAVLERKKIMMQWLVLLDLLDRLGDYFHSERNDCSLINFNNYRVLPKGGQWFFQFNAVQRNMKAESSQGLCDVVLINSRFIIIAQRNADLVSRGDFTQESRYICLRVFSRSLLLRIVECHIFWCGVHRLALREQPVSSVAVLNSDHVTPGP